VADRALKFLCDKLKFNQEERNIVVWTGRVVVISDLVLSVFFLFPYTYFGIALCVAEGLF